jgi:predicted ATP-binding protein involved in virulence
MSNFITEIKIKKVRHLENIDIKLGDSKKHLILTGKNGCGKSSVLEELDKIFNDIYTRRRGLFEPEEKPPNIVLEFNDIKNENAIYSFFPAKRGFAPSKSKGIQKVHLSKKKTQRLNSDFLQYIVNLKAERSFARDDNEVKIVEEIDEWFKRFENILREVYSDDSLLLTFDRRNIMSYNFIIEKENREVFDFHSLSDGYSSVIDIITELLLKVELTKSRSLEIEGIVLIDEIETHLHVELQKNILPLLISFFPNIQFIVTTHSPFVLQSIKNSIVYDLEKQLRVEDLSGHSYESLVDTYFDTDKYSDEVKEKLKTYKKLTLNDIDNNLDGEDLREYLKLEIFFENLPKYKNEEIGFQFNRIQQLKLAQ